MPTTITRIQKTRLGRFSLYGEEGFLFSLDSETYFSCGVEEGDTLSDVATKLKDAGLVLCTATSKPTQVVTPILKEKGLADYFDFIGGASMDESRDTKTAVVRYVLAQPMMQGKRVLMVGDRNDDMRGAADCGLDAAGALYGYGSREELEPFGPVLLAESCEELTDKLLACRANG